LVQKNDKETAVLREKKESRVTVWNAATEKYGKAINETDRAIEILKSRRLERTANLIDARLPAYEDTNFWVQSEGSPRLYLNTTGRDLVATRIAEIKKRNFDNWAKWVLLLAPLITGIGGILGIITGLVAVLRRR
jgi:hypothetical protein